MSNACESMNAGSGWRKLFSAERLIPIEKLVIGEDQRELSNDHVKELMEYSERGAKLCSTPLVVNAEITGQFSVIDGQHRLEAARALKKFPNLPCYVALQQLDVDEIFAIQQACDRENASIWQYTDLDLVSRIERLASLGKLQRSTRIAEMEKPTISWKYASKLLHSGYVLGNQSVVGSSLVDSRTSGRFGRVKQHHLCVAFIRDDGNREQMKKLMSIPNMQMGHWEQLNRKYRYSPASTMNVVDNIVSGDHSASAISKMIGDIEIVEDYDQQIANIMAGMNYDDVRSYTDFKRVIGPELAKNNNEIDWNEIPESKLLVLLRCSCKSCCRLRFSKTTRITVGTIARQMLKSIDCKFCAHMEKKTLCEEGGNSSEEEDSPPLEIHGSPAVGDRLKSKSNVGTPNKSQAPSAIIPTVSIGAVETGESRTPDKSSARKSRITARSDGDASAGKTTPVKAQSKRSVVVESDEGEIVADEKDGENNAVETGESRTPDKSSARKSRITARSDGDASAGKTTPVKAQSKRRVVVESDEGEIVADDSSKKTRPAGGATTGSTMDAVSNLSATTGEIVAMLVSPPKPHSRKSDQEINAIKLQLEKEAEEISARTKAAAIEASDIRNNSDPLLDTTACQPEKEYRSEDIVGVIEDLVNTVSMGEVEAVRAKNGAQTPATVEENILEFGQLCKRKTQKPLDDRASVKRKRVDEEVAANVECPSFASFEYYNWSLEHESKPTWLSEASFIFADARGEQAVSYLTIFKERLIAPKGSNERGICVCLCLPSGCDAEKCMRMLIGMSNVPDERILCRRMEAKFLCLSEDKKLGQVRDISNLHLWSVGNDDDNIMDKIAASGFVTVGDLDEISRFYTRDGKRLFFVRTEEHGLFDLRKGTILAEIVHNEELVRGLDNTAMVFMRDDNMEKYCRSYEFHRKTAPRVVHIPL